MGDMKIVLAIDDSKQQLDNYKLLLGQKYDLRIANSASSAMFFLRKNTVDIILLDIEMPNVNGFEFLRDIRGVPSKEDVPVIIVSGNSDAAFMEKAKNSSAMGVLTKPVRQDNLINTIEKAFAGK